MSVALSEGFENPPVQSSNAFRTLMDAMAQPGKIQSLPFELEHPEYLNKASTLIMLTLLDHETPVWVDQDLRTDAILEYLRFHCGTPISASTENSMFAFFSSCPNAETLAEFPAGTPEYPDSSTTFVIQVDALIEEGDVALSGPGIRTVNKFGAEGLNDSFWDWVKKNHADFPLGHDVFLASNDAIIALPRSVRVLEIA